MTHYWQLFIKNYQLIPSHIKKFLKLISLTKSKSIVRFNKDIYLLKTLLSSHSNHEYLIEFFNEDPYLTVLPILLNDSNRLYRTIHKHLGAYPTLIFYIEERIQLNTIKKSLSAWFYPMFIFSLGLGLIIFLNFFIIPYIFQYLSLSFTLINKLTLFYLGLLIGILLLMFILWIYFFRLINLAKYTQYRKFYLRILHIPLTHHLIKISLFLHTHQMSFLDTLKIIQNSKGLLGIVFKEAYLKLSKGDDFSEAYHFIDKGLLKYIILDKEHFDFSYIQEYLTFYQLKIEKKFHRLGDFFKVYAYLQMGLVIMLMYFLVLSPLSNLEKFL